MKKSYLSEAALALVAFIWGVTFVIVKDALVGIEPFAFNCIRFLLAAFLMFVLLLFQPREIKQFSILIAKAGITLGVWLFLGFSFLTLGLVSTNASNAGFITGSSVVLVPLVTCVLYKQKISKYAASGIVMAFFGLYCLMIKEGVSVNKGDFFVLLGAIAFSFHVIFTGKYSRICSPILLVLIQFCFVGTVSGCVAIVFEDLTIVSNIELFVVSNVTFALFFVAIISTGIAFLIQTKAQKNISPFKVVLIYSLEPVFAAFTSHIVHGESFGLVTFTGCLLIFSAMVLVELSSYFTIKSRS